MLNAIQNCRVINFKFLRDINFLYLQTFNDFKWTQFLPFNVPVHEILICAFFSSTTFIHDEDDKTVVGIQAHLLGRTFIVNRAFIVETFSFDDNGLTVEGPTPHHLLTNQNKATFLSPLVLLLNLIITYYIHPFNTKHSTIGQSDYWWLHLIMIGTQSNLTHFIFVDIVHCVRGCTSILHGMVLSYYLQALGLYISCDPSVPISKHRYIGAKSVALVSCNIQAGNFVPKAHRGRRTAPAAPADLVPSDSMTAAPNKPSTFEQHIEPLPLVGGDDMEKASSVPTAPKSSYRAPMDVHSFYTLIMGRFDTWD